MPSLPKNLLTLCECGLVLSVNRVRPAVATAWNLPVCCWRRVMLLYRLKLARELKALVRIVERSSPAVGDKNERCWGILLHAAWE